MKLKPTKTTDRNESGQGLTEYLILLLLISMGSIAVATSLGGTIKNKIKLAREHIDSDIGLKD